MKFYLTIFFLAFFPFWLIGQQSGGCYGFGTSNYGDEAYDIIQDNPSGDIVVVGKTGNYDGDAYMVRFEPGTQKIEWEQMYGTSNEEEVGKAVVAHNGSYYMAGFTKGTGSKDIFIVQIDPADGSVENHKVIGGSNTDIANDIIATNNGNLAITGNTTTTQNNNSMLTYVIEFSMSANSFSIKDEFAFGTGGKNDGNALAQDSNGDFWVVGGDDNNSKAGIIYQLKQGFSNNTAGDVIYQAKLTDNNNYQTLNDIEIDIDQNNITYIVAAGTGNFGSVNLSTKGAFALKIDASTTNPQQIKAPVERYSVWGTNNVEEKGFGITPSSGGYSITGTNGNGELLAFEIREDFSNIRWNKVSGGGSEDLGNTVTELSTGELFCAGKSESSAYSNGNSMFFLTALTSAGANCCASNYKSFTRYDLDPQKSLNKNNSGFSTYKSQLSQNINSLNNVANSYNDGQFESGTGCGALPVEFMGFEVAKCSSDQVKITWQTASETNNHYFNVLRSRSGENFRSIGRREGQGTKLSSTAYSFLDEDITPGTYYYKIRQTDFDGSTSTSNIKAIQLGDDPASKLSIESAWVQDGKLRAKVRGVAKAHYKAHLYNSRGQAVGNQVLKPLEGKQTLTFQTTDQTQVLYLRIVDRTSGASIDTRKVLTTP
jgi:hypothetical protein